MQKLTKGREYIFHKNGPFLKDMYFNIWAYKLY